MSGLEALDAIPSSLEVYSHEKQLYTTKGTDLAGLNSRFASIDHTARAFKLGPLRQLVLFAAEPEVAQAHATEKGVVVVCSKADRLDRAILAQTIYQSCTVLE